MADLSVQDVFGGEDLLIKLLADLDEVFPQRTPTPDDSLSKLMFEAGQRNVIDYLYSLTDNVLIP
jgi:hypothetical protein